MQTIRSRFRPIYYFFKNFRNQVLLRPFWGYMDITAQLDAHVLKSIAPKIHMYEHVAILGKKTNFIISPKGQKGHFIVKKNSGIASGLTVITGNHNIFPTIGVWCKKTMADHLDDIDKDVIVEEDVWIGANVTLMAGVIVGRGSVIGAGSVLRMSVPPYSFVIGNPAKVVGFKFTPEEVIVHEKVLYSKEERLPIDLLEKNYEVYFISKMKDIKQYLNIKF